jgi:hypothetical protein
MSTPGHGLLGEAMPSPPPSRRHHTTWSGNRPEAVAWRPSANDTEAPRIVEIESVFAKTATILARDSYAGAYAAYPVWGKTTCLIVGMAAPVARRGRARQSRA